MKIQLASLAEASNSLSNAPLPTLKGGSLYRDNRLIVLPAGAEQNLVGREDVGRAVWEALESEVKTWEEEEKHDEPKPE